MGNIGDVWVERGQAAQHPGAPALKPATSGSAAAFQSAKKYHQRPPSPRGSPIELVNSCASSAASSTATSVVAAVATAAIAAGPPPRSPSSATSVRVFFLLCCRLRAAAPRSSPVPPLLSKPELTACPSQVCLDRARDSCTCWCHEIVASQAMHTRVKNGLPL